MDSDQARFEKLVLAYSSDLYRFAYMLCHNESMAQDLVQETFMRAWRFFGSLREEAKAKSWLMTTVRREFARQFERYQPGFDDVEMDELAGEQGVVDADVLALRKALHELPLKYREVMALQVTGGYRGTEIAELLDLPRATVNTRLFRARQHLREALDTGAEMRRPRRRST